MSAGLLCLPASLWPPVSLESIGLFLAQLIKAMEASEIMGSSWFCDSR